MGAGPGFEPGRASDASIWVQQGVFGSPEGQLASCSRGCAPLCSPCACACQLQAPMHPDSLQPHPRTHACTHEQAGNQASASTRMGWSAHASTRTRTCTHTHAACRAWSCPLRRRPVPLGPRPLPGGGHPGAAAALPAHEQPVHRLRPLLPVGWVGWGGGGGGALRMGIRGLGEDGWWGGGVGQVGDGTACTAGWAPTWAGHMSAVRSALQSRRPSVGSWDAGGLRRRQGSTGGPMARPTGPAICLVAPPLPPLAQWAGPSLPPPGRRALYSVLGSPELFRSTKAPLFLSLLFKVRARAGAGPSCSLLLVSIGFPTGIGTVWLQVRSAPCCVVRVAAGKRPAWRVSNVACAGAVAGLHVHQRAQNAWPAQLSGRSVPPVVCCWRTPTPVVRRLGNTGQSRPASAMLERPRGSQPSRSRKMRRHIHPLLPSPLRPCTHDPPWFASQRLTSARAYPLCHAIAETATVPLPFPTSPRPLLRLPAPPRLSRRMSPAGAPPPLPSACCSWRRRRRRTLPVAAWCWRRSCSRCVWGGWGGGWGAGARSA